MCFNDMNYGRVVISIKYSGVGLIIFRADNDLF